MRLAVVVPATDAPLTLERCLRAIRTAEEPPDELEVVEAPHRMGPAAARNLGTARTTGDVVVFVDADVVVAPDSFTRIRAHFRDDPAPVAVFGSYDDAVETQTLAARFRNLLHHHVHTRAAGEATTFWAGLGAVRRDAFEEVGGFDPEQRMLEDIELGLRLSGAGGRLVLDPLIRGTHLKNWTFRQMVKTDFADRGVPWVHLMLDHRDVPTTLNLGWRDRASALVSCAALVFALRRRPIGATASAAVLVALNRPFYSVLCRKLGATDAVRSVPIHIAHHVAGVAAVPVALLTYPFRRRR